MLKIAIVGYGNVGRAAREAVDAAPDMVLVQVAEAPGVPIPEDLKDIWVTDLRDVRADAALLCLPSRLCPDAAETLLSMGINTVDAFDIHGEIPAVKARLDAVAKVHGTAAVLSAGWDPGTDSLLRALFEAMAPRGISYTDFGPGMSMGHSVVAKSKAGVKNALSMTMPVGAGVHRRMVYVELADGAALADVTAAIKSDPYFSHDETHVIPVADIGALQDVGHGVRMTRKGVSGDTHNQLFEFSMRINNPALTSQVMAGCARAAVRQTPGCYTMIELPVVDLLPGERDEWVKKLV
ncbi:MAG: diaminopimelate dehydrogenase [Clostridiales bacterium]|nr:diaminopimelate dehydrogenase [Clostridiales bacterium]